MLSNRKLIYNRVYVDSQRRLPQSDSSSDFVIQTNGNLETHPNTVMYIMDEVIPQSYYTTPEGFFQFLYVIVYNTSSGLVENYLTSDLKNQVFFVSQLAGRIGNLLSQEADNAGLPSNLFTASYDSDQRRMMLNTTDHTYSFKIPGLRIAEVLRQSGLITPSEVLQNVARTGRTTNQVSREAQALRNYREEAVNIDDNFLQSI